MIKYVFKLIVCTLLIIFSFQITNVSASRPDFSSSDKVQSFFEKALNDAYPNSRKTIVRVREGVSFYYYKNPSDAKPVNEVGYYIFTYVLILRNGNMREIQQNYAATTDGRIFEELRRNQGLYRPVN